MATHSTSHSSQCFSQKMFQFTQLGPSAIAVIDSWVGDFVSCILHSCLQLWCVSKHNFGQVTVCRRSRIQCCDWQLSSWHFVLYFAVVMLLCVMCFKTQFWVGHNCTLCRGCTCVSQVVFPSLPVTVKAEWLTFLVHLCLQFQNTGLGGSHHLCVAVAPVCPRSCFQCCEWQVSGRWPRPIINCHLSLILWSSSTSVSFQNHPSDGFSSCGSAEALARLLNKCYPKV